MAVKLIDCAFGANAAASSGAAEAALREAQLSKGLDHPCIVRVGGPPGCWGYWGCGGSCGAWV